MGAGVVAEAAGVAAAVARGEICCRSAWRPRGPPVLATLRRARTVERGPDPPPRHPLPAIPPASA